MATYSVRWRRSAAKDLDAIDRQVIPRIMRAVDALAVNPFGPGVRKLQGTLSTYRTRVGDYRIVFTIFESELFLEIIRVAHRKDAYRE